MTQERISQKQDAFCVSPGREAERQLIDGLREGLGIVLGVLRRMKI